MSASPTPQPALEKLFELEHHVVKAVFFHQARGTVVTFEPMTSTLDTMSTVEGMGERFYQGMGFNTVAVIPRGQSWYRTPDILKFLAQLVDSGTLRRYPMTATFGFSMGAYGAMTYAALLGADAVLSVAPITSLDPRVAPFETRFSTDLPVDWDGPCVDGAVGVAETNRFVCVYDPLSPPDDAHMRRVIKAREAMGLGGQYLRLPGVGHKTMGPLVFLDLIKTLSAQTLSGSIDAAAFHRAARARRRLEQYYVTMAGSHRVRCSRAFQRIVSERKAAMRRSGRLIPMVDPKALPNVANAEKLPWAVLAQAGAR